MPAPLSIAALGDHMLVEAMRLDSPPRAIIYASDDLAVGAILRAQREGIAIPALDGSRWRGSTA